MAEALLRQHGAAGIVSLLRAATQQRQPLRAANLCAALMVIEDEADNVAAHGAGAAAALVDVVENWRDNAVLCQAALCALFHTWGGGVAFFNDGTSVPTEQIVQTIVDTLHNHASERYTAQAAMRLLMLFTASPDRLLMLPTVIDAVEQAAKSFPDDDSVQHWAALIICNIHAIPEDAIVQTHGARAYATICTTSLALADSAPRPATVFVGDTPWFDAIVDILSAPKPTPP